MNPNAASMMRAMIVILLALGFAHTAVAKPRTKVYPGVTCDRMWKAVENVADDKKSYTSSMLDDKRMKAELVTGHGAWTGKRTIYITLSNAAEGCEVAVEGVFSGLAHNDKGDLFTRLESALKDLAPDAPAAESTK